MKYACICILNLKKILSFDVDLNIFHSRQSQEMFTEKFIEITFLLSNQNTVHYSKNIYILCLLV